MKPAFYKYLVIIASLYFTFSQLNAQENSMKNCDKFISEGYMPDGQEHNAKLDENNSAKFYCTFYGGSQYRIAGCTDHKDFPLIISVFDQEKNLLFCNKNHNNASFWNFTFTSTVDCVIIFEFESETLTKSDVRLLIGFKEK